MALDLKMVRSNLPPRTIMRGPGFLTSVMVIERVMEHVAQTLGLEPTLVRERNFLQALPPSLVHTPPPPPSQTRFSAGSWGQVGAHGCSVASVVSATGL